MKRMFVLFFLSLNFSGLFGYTDLIITLRKGDSRFILIGDYHEESPFIDSEQEPFFKKFMAKLDTIEKNQPNTVVVYHEGLYGIEKLHQNEITLWDRMRTLIKRESFNPELFIPDKNPERYITTEMFKEKREKKEEPFYPLLLQYYYSMLSDICGETLAKIRFKHNYKFKTENYDIREGGNYDNADEKQKIYDCMIESILEDLPPEYTEAFKKISDYKIEDPNSEEDKKMFLMETATAAMDLGLLEKLISEEFKPHSVFVVHAGKKHIENLSTLLQVNGWELVDEIEKSRPKKWFTTDPYLGIELKLLPFLPKIITLETQKKIEKDIAEAIAGSKD